MKLSYLHKTNLNTHAPLVLNKGNRRIEFYISRDGEGSFTLFAYAGEDNSLPHKHKSQGPFQLRPQAIAVRNAILSTLTERGYKLNKQANTIWELRNQQQLNALRAGKLAFDVDTTFKPGDVFLDW